MRLCWISVIDDSSSFKAFVTIGKRRQGLWVPGLEVVGRTLYILIH